MDLNKQYNCTKKPELSVIMGVLCLAEKVPQLEQAVCSILKQQYSNFELLICDDGSCTEAKMLLEQMASFDLRIQLLRPNKCFSLPHKLNHCLQHAEGFWIARMDDDDFSHPDRFMMQIQYLKRHPEFDFVGCNVNEILSQRVIRKRIMPKEPSPKDFQFAMPFVHPTLIFRSEAIRSIGGYSEDKYCLLCEDYDLLLRMYASGHRGANVQEILFDYSVDNIIYCRRKFKYRVNETITRFKRFSELNMLPKAFPYVVKPLVLGVMPLPFLNYMRKKKNLFENQKRKNSI